MNTLTPHTTVRLTLSILVVVTLPLLAAACLDLDFGSPMTSSTTLNSDGSVERRFVFDSNDSSEVDQNAFGISESKGWKVIINTVIDSVKIDSVKYGKREMTTIEFTKTFESIDKANLEMATPSDSLLVITSAVKTNFRWFYTDVEFTDTYKSGYLYKDVSPGEFFTEDDITRMKESMRFDKKSDVDTALENSMSKKFDAYVERGLLELFIRHAAGVIEKKSLGKNWIDTLNSKKERIARILHQQGGPDAFGIIMNDSLRIPIKLDEGDLNGYYKLEEKRNDLLWNFANVELHSIKMPTAITSSNADSVSGNQAFWKHPGTILFVKDFEMTAVSRRMNYWAWIVTIGGIALFIFILSRKKKTA